MSLTLLENRRAAEKMSKIYEGMLLGEAKLPEEVKALINKEVLKVDGVVIDEEDEIFREKNRGIFKISHDAKSGSFNIDAGGKGLKRLVSGLNEIIEENVKKLAEGKKVEFSKNSFGLVTGFSFKNQ